jgi:prophage DNA circulation protein
VTGWRDQLRPASWRGLACHVEAAEAAGGRRLALHEYPLRDEPYPEDMGRRPRAWTVTAFLLGADVLTAAQKFADALEAEGAGTWVDPWRGELKAVVDQYSWRQSSAEGGIARFEISFREAGEAAYPELAPDHASAVEAAAGDAWERTKEKFGEGFSVTGLIEALKTDAADLVGLSVADVTAWAGTAAATLEQTAAWARAGLQLAADARALIENPSLLIDEALSFLGHPRMAGLDWRTWLNIASWAPALLGATTPEQGANRGAYIQAIRTAGAIGAAKAAAGAEFTTYDDAIAARGEIMDALDVVAATADAALFERLATLRTAVVTAVSAAAPRLPRVRTITRPQPLPALALAWELYGDRPGTVPARADEVTARNRVPHPLFVAPPVEVLSHG